MHEWLDRAVFYVDLSCLPGKFTYLTDTHKTGAKGVWNTALQVA